MKFARQLHNLERNCAMQWRGKFIRYKALKKSIRKCRNDEDGCDVSQVEANDAKFFKQLEAEVKAVNRNFERAAQEVLAASKRHALRKHRTPTPASCLSFLKRPRPLDELSAAELAAASSWCRQYAVVNATGLRKIAKKHDKYCGGSAGSRFLQSCWDSGHLQWGSFLHSPLMDELLALEELLNKLAAQEVHRSDGCSPSSSSPPPAHSGKDLSGSSAVAVAAAAASPQTAGPDSEMEDAQVALSAGPTERAAHLSQRSLSPSDSLPFTELSPPQSEVQDSAMMCPICLDPMYLPLGLTCGHKFCTECALHAAGLHLVRGPLRFVLHTAPSQTACPECRQGGVYPGALLLKKLAIAIAHRFPQETAARAKEAKEEARRLGRQRPDWYDKAQQLLAPFAAGL